MRRCRIATIPGDGIGPEVIDASNNLYFIDGTVVREYDASGNYVRDIGGTTGTREAAGWVAQHVAAS